MSVPSPHPLTLTPAALALLAFACAPPNPAPTFPFEDGWERQIFAFDHADGAITALSIGGQVGPSGEFANRGDISVVYDAKAKQIWVDARRFTRATSPDRAEADFARLKTWIYNQNVDSPRAPEDMPAQALCGPSVWREGCSIRTYYDGRDQLGRSGMDFLIHLPPDFVGKVEIATEDNLAQDDYLDRGNVCIWDLPGSADVELQQGQVLVKLADSIRATPSCPSADLLACETAGWATSCPCLAAGDGFGTLAVEGRRSDIVIQTPPELWTRITMQSAPAQAGAGRDADCRAAIDVPGAVVEPADFPWSARGQTNQPADALAGGYAISGFSDSCGPTILAERPDAFSSEASGVEDPRRGDLTVCANCIQNASCEDFLDVGLRRAP